MPYFEPTSSERRGMLILGIAVLLVLLVAFISLWRRGGNRAESDGTDSTYAGHARPQRKSPYYAVPERQAEAFPFDPNTADSTTLLRLGFAPFQVRGMYKYRAMGGRYHEPADVQRVPGMTNELWERLAPYIRIDRKFQYVTPPSAKGRAQHVDIHEELVAHRDTVRYPMKLTEGLVIDLNESDTSALKKVPGIGSYYARQIVRYREQLGGFVSLAQLQEIEGMPEDVERWFRLGDSPIRRIDVNHATKNQLVRHPYLRVYRARAIWDKLHNTGPLQGIDDLRSLPDFTDSDIERLRPYLEFK